MSVTMEGSTGSEGVDKPWDHAWSTEEMRKNRREWSLAGDSGLLKHLQQFSENLTKRANETQDALNSMTSQLNEAAILVDNITNTSLALANTQFIESRVQEDNVEIEQPVENVKKNENDQEFSATDLLVSVCESIRQGLCIMDEKYEKVEVVASDSEDEDDNTVPSVILRPKDRYQDRPLPYVFGTEQWKSSNKVGLESSSSESEQNDEDEDSMSDTEDKNIGKMLSSNARTNLGISRLSSTSSESNDYNAESSSIKDTDNNRLHARSQDTLNSDTEPTTPSSVLPKTQNISNGPPSFAEELAKRLGNVLPFQKNVVVQESNEQVINRTKDDIFTPEDDQDVFNNKSDKLFSEGTNLFSDEVSSSSWKNKPVRPVNKNIIPPSIDVPPPLSIISSAPKSTIDDLFGDADESEDSDDIFSKKSSKDIFAAERETIRSEVLKQKNSNIENVQNSSTMTTSTPEVNDKGKGLFEDEEDDLFRSASKPAKPPDAPSLGSSKKKPIGGVSIFGKVDVLSSSKFARRPSSSSSSDSDSTEQHVGSNNSEHATTVQSTVNSKSSSASGSANVFSSLEAGNNVGNAAFMSSENNTGSSSGVSVRQPSIDNTPSSSLGADFQPLMTSSRLKSEEIYRERVASDSLFASSRSRTNNSNEQRQKQQQQSQQQSQQQQSQAEDVSEHEDVFGPPPLPKSSDGPRPKSKVASLFDDSDSGDDLFASASPGSRSLHSSERTPSRAQSQQQQQKKSLFDDDDDLFGAKDAPDVDLFAAPPIKSLPQVTDGLFDEPASDGLFKPKSSGATKKSKSSSLFEGLSGSGLFADPPKSEEIKPSSGNSGLFKEPPKVEKVPKEKKASKGLFDDAEDSDLFAKPAAPAEKGGSIFSGSSKSIFEDTPDSDLFGSNSNALEKNVDKSKSNLFSDSKDQTDLFGSKMSEPKGVVKNEPTKDLFEDKSKPKKLTTSIFDDSDDDDQDLFGGSSLSKKSPSSKSIFGENKGASVVKSMDEEKKKVEDDKKVEEPPEAIKPAVKNSIFDDDDDDDLFGDKKKKAAPAKEEDEKSAKEEEKPANAESKAAQPDVAQKKAMFAEIKQKLEKHKLAAAAEPPAKAKDESSVVDGAAFSKKDPPKTLKIQTTLPMPTIDEPQQPAPKKPAVSNKIMNLIGKVGDLKILSPTDTPPLWRKNSEEKNGKDEEQKEDAAAGELGSSEASTPTLASGASSPQTSGGTNSRARDSPSLRSDKDNTEVAISLDEPAQVETLTSIASSKSRARIPGKRRPQSRQARQSAIRQSGIDFDIVDASITSPVTEQPNGDATDAQLNVDRLLPTKAPHSEGTARHSATDSSQHADDKSEISASRNTTTNLLSPSTDEEDLFDVPPDLPEDPAAKEDSLFGRAPILSPIETVEKSAKTTKTAKKESVASKSKETPLKEEDAREEKKEEKDKPLDPLRDSSHDPLKDPSQLFAFVTKTPSPEKNIGLLMNEEDDSLFSSSSKPVETKSKPALDLFFDDDDTSSSDLFSSSISKIKKPMKDTKIDLFDDTNAEDDDDDSLFGSATKKSEKTEKSKENVPATSATSVTTDEKPIKRKAPDSKTTVKGIFDSGDDDDIFGESKKTIPKKKTTSLFDDDGDNADDDDIFGKPKSSLTKESKAPTDSGRPVVKKAVTRDLKKTAEQIVEDPLSMLQDD